MLARRNLSKKRIIILGGALGLVWVIIGVVVYRNFVPKTYTPPPSTVVVPINQDPNTPIIEPNTPIVVSVDILRDAKLTNLKLFGEVPLEVKVLGREDPFSLINP